MLHRIDPKYSVMYLVIELEKKEAPTHVWVAAALRACRWASCCEWKGASSWGCPWSKAARRTRAELRWQGAYRAERAGASQSAAPTRRYSLSACSRSCARRAPSTDGSVLFKQKFSYQMHCQLV